MLERWRNQTNLVNVLFAVILFVSPWLLGFSYETAGLNAWASALLLGLVSVVAILSYAEWEEWLDLALGAWILGSPWVLKFGAGSAATKVHVMIGLIVTVMAVVELWKEHSQPPQDIKLLR